MQGNGMTDKYTGDDLIQAMIERGYDSPRQVAKWLGVTHVTVWRWMGYRQRELPPVAQNILRLHKVKRKGR